MKKIIRKQHLAAALVASAIAGLTGQAAGQVVIDFEGPNPLASPLISGDLANFAGSSEFADSGTQSVRFQDNTPEPYESWSYVLPEGFETGTVTLWFRSLVDVDPQLDANTWGAAFLIEDLDNRADFGAVEISNSVFGPQRQFWGSEGAEDRLVAGDRFESNSFPNRDEEWHEVTFEITPEITLVKVDGIASDEIAAPGSEVSPGVPRRLGFRHVAGSPTNGGFQNYITGPNPDSFTVRAAPRRVFIDDFSVNQATPSVLAQAIGFEIVNGTADYDTPTIQSVSPKVDIIPQRGFVNTFVVADIAEEEDSDNIRTGSGSATFDPSEKRLRRLEFDLSDAEPGSITLKFYDSLGQDTGRNKFGGSIVLQDGIDPTKWIAIEIWNFNFPASSPLGDYRYFGSTSVGQPATFSSFRSNYFGPRTVGWQDVEIILTETESRIRVNGLENVGNFNAGPGAGLQIGPGLNRNPRLLLLADSASQGGSRNFAQIDELDQQYESTGTTVSTPYVWYDTITLPIPATAGIPGDINGDGILNVADVTQLGQLVAGNTPPSLEIGDLNDDGEVDELDVQALAELIVNN